MCVINEGPAARRPTKLDDADRKAVVVGELLDWLGTKASLSIEYHARTKPFYRSAISIGRDVQPRPHPGC